MTTTTTRKQSPAQARKSALDSDFAVLYAVAGVADTVVAQAKTTLIETRDRAAKRVAELLARQGELEAHARSGAEDITTFLRSLPKQVKMLPETTRNKLAEAQQQAQSVVVGATGSYGDLAGRGKRAVDEAIVSARRFSTTAERRAEGLVSEMAERVDPAFEKVQETVTLARQRFTGHTATATVTSRSAAKASASRAAAGATAAERATARSAAARKAAAKRTAAQKAPTKKVS